MKSGGQKRKEIDDNDSKTEDNKESKLAKQPNKEKSQHHSTTSILSLPPTQKTKSISIKELHSSFLEDCEQDKPSMPSATAPRPLTGAANHSSAFFTHFSTVTDHHPRDHANDVELNGSAFFSTSLTLLPPPGFYQHIQEEHYAKISAEIQQDKAQLFQMMLSKK